MNIVLISTWDTECGIATYSGYLKRALGKLGHRVYVAAEHTKESLSGQKVRGDQWYRLWDRRAPYGSPHGLEQIFRLLAVIKDPIVHIQHEFGLFPGEGLDMLEAALQVQKIKYVTTLHTVVPYPLQRGYFHNPLRTRGSFVVHTEAAVACLRGLGCELIPHGTTPIAEPLHGPNWGQTSEAHQAAREELGVSKSHFLALCPGFMGSNKGQVEIAEAYGMMGSTPALQLAFVGQCRDEAYLSELHGVLSKYGLRDKAIVQSSFCEDAVMAKWFQAANFVVLGGGKTSPYSASGQLHQAMGYGLPILAKNTPIYRSGGGAGVLHYNNATELAMLMRGLAGNYRLGNQLGERSLEAARARSWDVVAQAHVNHYQSLEGR